MRSLIFVCAIFAAMTLQACASGSSIWDPGQDTLVPGPSNSSAKAVLPAGVKIIPPGKDIPQSLAAFSGIWSGWVSQGAECDVKIAVERLTFRGALLNYAFACTNKEVAPWAIRIVGRYKDGVLTSDFANDQHLWLGLREDGSMKIMLIVRGVRMWGVLSKDRT